MIILLTATFKSYNKESKRLDINDRLNDYIQSLTFFIKNTDVEIVFVENSNYSTNALDIFLQNPRVEFLQYSGKSYINNQSESQQVIESINYAISNSLKLSSSDYILRLNGRYIINPSLITPIFNKEFIFFEKVKKFAINWIFTDFFKVPKQFWIDNLSNSSTNDLECKMYNQVRTKEIIRIKDIELKGITELNNNVHSGLFNTNVFLMRFDHYYFGLLDLIDTLPSNLNMIEIGSYIGESSELFLKSGKINNLTCIDIWTSSQTSHSLRNTAFFIVEELFDKRLKNYTFNKIKENSNTAHRYIEDNSVDFVYIDGSHTYENVKKDIENYLPKIKPGGIIAGHDYRKDFTGVVRAVNEKFKTIEVFKDTSWLVRL